MPIILSGTIPKERNIMNKKSLFALILSFAAFSASVYSLASATAYRPPAHDVPLTSSAERPVNLSPSDDGFRVKVIRLYNGSIGVFTGDADIPDEILPADLSALPADAVARLRKGIYVRSREEYLNYIEDFSVGGGQ